MKRILIVPLIFLISISAFAQKVNIRITQTTHAGLSDLQVIDNQNNAVYSGTDFINSDSLSFNLEANNYYFLKISVSGITNPDTILLLLSLNGEPILRIKTDIGPGDHLFPFYTGTRGRDAKITGGTSANISEFPWQVYYISGNFRCGGSIISNKWVVTAAHCTKNSTGGAIPASSMFVRVGLNNPSSSTDGKMYSVTEAIVNEGFDDKTLLNDIALLRIKDSINFPNATPIKLVTSDDVNANAIVPGVMSWVTGWGYTHLDPNVVPTSLQKVQLPIISNEQASTVWTDIPATDLMAGYLNGNKDACSGDSGGPLVVPVLGEYKLAGIVSWGSSNCNTYGAYTRVSDFLAWITSKTGIKTIKPSNPEGEKIICEGVESSQYTVAPVAGATSYEWKLLPESAGSISGNSVNASVIWNAAFFGPFNVIVRVTVNGQVSDWGRLDGNKAVNTRITGVSNDTVICAGNPVTLSVNAVGFGLTYTWFKDNQVIPMPGAPQLVLLTAKASDSGVYKCQVSAQCGTVVSRNITLTVYAVTKVIKVSPDVEVPFGKSQTLVVNAEGHDLAYEWLKDGKPVENSNSPQLVLNNVNATDIGVYKVSVKGTCGSAVSDTVYVYVKKKDEASDPQVFLWPSITSEEFNVALNNDAVYNIRIYSVSGIKVREQSNCRYQTSVSIVNLASGVYIVEIFNNDFRKTVKIIRE